MNNSTTGRAVIILGLVLVVAVAGVIALALRGQTVPDLLQNIAVGDLTGLLGLLVPSDRVTPPRQP